MSEPTRYRIADNQAQLTLGGGILVVDPAGQLVDYADYARLKAENERLRKAGDMMYSWLGVCGRRNNSFGDDWLRAKKGAMLQHEQFNLDMANRGWTGWSSTKGGQS